MGTLLVSVDALFARTCGPSWSPSSLAAAAAWSRVVSGLFSSVLSLGLVACIVSHYRMGARSWSERRSRPAPHDPQPYQHVLLPPVQSVRAARRCGSLLFLRDVPSGAA